MFSIEQSYSRIFRPWDVCDKKIEFVANCDNTDVTIDTKRRKFEEKRENRLRKIRGSFKKTDVSQQQDSTVSTTTEDSEDEQKPDIVESSSPVTSLSLCCDRLLQEPEQKEAKDKKTLKSKPKRRDSLCMSPHAASHSVPQPLYPFMPDYLPTGDIAHALGVPPTDPLLLESLAQGYAMELEYARILHQENETKLMNARKHRPKKYKCPHCQVGFSNNGQLKGHIRIHTGERPFKCDEKNCGKSFTRNEELTRHKRIHSGVRPFPCPTCGKKFGRRDHLKKHTKTHYLQAERMMPVFVPLSAMPHVANFPYLYGY